MANERQFDRCCGKQIDHIAVRGLLDDEGKEVSSYVPSWLELRWKRQLFEKTQDGSIVDLGLRFACRFRQGNALEPRDFLQSVGVLEPRVMAWLQDHAPEGNGQPARPYISRDNRRLDAAARCFIPTHDPTVKAGMEGLILVEEFHYATLERLMTTNYTAESFADKERTVLKSDRFEKALYMGVDLTQREDGSVVPLGFVVAIPPRLHNEGNVVRVFQEGYLVYLYPEVFQNKEGLGPLAEAHAWATWQIPAALVGELEDAEEPKQLPASTESGKAIASDGTPSVTSPGGST